ncbi:hypothetical protein P3X46_021101 [Hevea brasiliensis]|uniref:B-like cyclin n=1 Tax=Hevea brasiliensis TaxID=3981 RepID=A0ABQ9LEH1_HEVBR|nr:cyclin-D5-1-like [Hevea brasiliensis]KAJ9166327.1 hypothetical protein P3X46_021101 [Hevea brasiliensis]
MEGESISELFCQESETCLAEEVTDEDTFIDMTKGSADLCRAEEENGYLEMLVERDITFSFKSDQSMGFDNWVKCVRLEAIAWILKTRAVFGFRFQTAYLSITYFDRFLSKRSIENEKLWAVRLLSVACLSLAAKMEEIKAPALSEFHTEDYNFESKVIQRMEFLVLNTLEWRMISITPFAFLHYLIIKFFKGSPPRHILSRIVGFISALIREINLMDHRPSVIAAATTLMALDQSLTRQALECKMNSISYSGFEIEDVFQCYTLVQKLEMENLKTPKLVNSQDLSPAAQLNPIDVLENSSVTCANGTKRKRLAFDNSDKNFGLTDEKQR